MYRTIGPFDRAVYSCLDGGVVEVSVGDRTGRFDGDGRWIDGELRAADPAMCRWVSTATGVPNRHAESLAARQPDSNR